MNKKAIAIEFLNLASTGKVRDAYRKYVHSDFTHHNPHFKGDRESLLLAMEENALQFPNKTYQVLRALEDADLVMVHGKIELSADSLWSVIHIFRFENNKIIEEWEAAQQVLKERANENGIF